MTALPLSGGAADDGAAVARGAYLAAAAGCDHCHTDAEHGGQPYAGRRLKTEFGMVLAPNITPDQTHGIGAWSLADFTRALRWGIAPDDSHYVPTFPFPFFGRLTDPDIADLKAYLDTVAPVARTNAAGADSPAPLARTRAVVAVALGPAPAPWRPDPSRDAAWNRGAYLAATVGRCGDCHTPRDVLGRPIADRFMAGSSTGHGGKKAPNITPDPAAGIGNWSEDDIVTLLDSGETPDSDFVGGAMADIVKNTARLTEADRKAIAVYLMSLPPRPAMPKR